MDDIEINKIHQAMAIEIMEEMTKGEMMSTPINDENILNLIEKGFPIPS